MTAAVPASGVAAGGGGCAGIDDLAAGGKRRRPHRRGELPERLAALMTGKTVLAIGPGLGQSPETIKFTTGLLSATKNPGGHRRRRAEYSGRQAGAAGQAGQRDARWCSRRIPARWRGSRESPIAEVQANRLEVARELCPAMGVTLVLKGARTMVAHPDGRVAVNTTGNPGMAKGGSGDLLTGMVAGLLAQYPGRPGAGGGSGGLSARSGGGSGGARRPTSTHCWRRTALRSFLGLFAFARGGPNGYVWLQGLPAEYAPAAASYEEAR